MRCVEGRFPASGRNGWETDVVSLGLLAVRSPSIADIAKSVIMPGRRRTAGDIATRLNLSYSLRAKGSCMRELESEAEPSTVTREPKPSRLKRLRDALRARDWLGIGIELAVVTIGILLAFEIEQWGEERQRAKEEHIFLERLHAEYGRATDEMRDVIRHHERIMHDFRAAFAVKNKPVLLREYSTKLNFGCRAGYLGTAPFSDTVAAELINSGRLNIITDAGLRGEIRDLTTAQAWLRDRAVLGTEVARDANAYLTPYYRYEILADGRSTCRVLWNELLSDQDATTAAVRTYRMHELVGGGRRELLAMTHRVRHAIGCKLDKPDCR